MCPRLGEQEPSLLVPMSLSMKDDLFATHACSVLNPSKRNLGMREGVYVEECVIEPDKDAARSLSLCHYDSRESF